MVYRFPLPDCKLHGDELHPAAPTRPSARSRAFSPKDAQEGRAAAARSLFTHDLEGREARRRSPLPLHAGQRRASRPSAAGRARTGHAMSTPGCGRNCRRSRRTKPFARHAVFLLDTSLSEHPDRFARQHEAAAEDPGKRCGHQAVQHPDLQRRRRLGRAQGLAANTTAGREKALSQLDGIVLEGATDLGARPGQACDGRLRRARRARRSTCFLLSDGHITWGETDVTTLVAPLRAAAPFAYALPLLPHRPGRRERGAVRGPDPQGRRHLQLLQRGRPRPRRRRIAISACRSRASASSVARRRATC